MRKESKCTVACKGKQSLDEQKSVLTQSKTVGSTQHISIGGKALN